MAVIGNLPQVGNITIANDAFNGNGSTTTFTLSQNVGATTDIEVIVDNVQQSPYDGSYSVAGTSLTFSTAPATGTNNVYVIYNFARTATTTQVIPDDGSVTPAKTTFYKNSSTEPASPTTGDQWWDPSEYALKIYDGVTWQLVAQSFEATGGTITEVGNYRIHTFTSSGTFTVNKGSSEIEYLVIAGGGGGGTQSAGGGGAGGYRSSVIGEMSGGGSLAESRLTLTSGAYAVTVGAGGAGTPAGTSATRPSGSNGANSSFGAIVSIGGGGGSSYRPNGSGYAGSSGGSGGGGGIWYGLGGSGTSGQGYAGGQGGTDNQDASDNAGGGGGAGQIGQSYGNGPANGGNGVASSITGTSIYRAGGGGGAQHATNHLAGVGGLGGGGDGGNTNLDGGNATANTGSGGGGGSEWSNVGGNGASGIVIIRYVI